jgi:hypothetical protein
MKPSNKDSFTERAAKALEGIEMLLAMWIQKSVPAAELWVGEAPEPELTRRAWRPAEGTPKRRFKQVGEPAAVETRLEHIEERLNRLASELATLETRVHEERPD